MSTPAVITMQDHSTFDLSIIVLRLLVEGKRLVGARSTTGTSSADELGAEETGIGACVRRRKCAEH